MLNGYFLDKVRPDNFLLLVFLYTFAALKENFSDIGCIQYEIVSLFQVILTIFLKSVKKCLGPFLKFAIPIVLFIVQIPFKHCQQGIQKQILNILRKIQDS